MKLTRRSAVKGMAALALGSGVIRPAHASNLKWAHVYETGEPFHQQALWAAEEIRRRTDGRVNITVFPASQLGNESQLNEALSLGTIDIIYTGAAFAGVNYPPISISHAPYMFRDFGHWQAYRQSEVFARNAAAYQENTGQRLVTLTYYGERHLTANQAITRPGQMRGLKLRVPPVPVFLMFSQAVGAEATPIAFADVYDALKRGLVEAQENPLPTIMAKKFHEVQSHIMLTGHITDSLLTLVGGHVWAGLSDDQKTIMEDVLRTAANRATEEIRKAETELVGAFKRLGVTVVEVDRQAFINAVVPLHNNSKAGATWGRADYDALQAL
ncbi:sialic acid TRAP transporter substrate-binding protein SiaP [Rhizobium sp. RU36D]|uniref:sialic acid TRAP transporter substrate-binding protein SiaP n=1 Tax=Rhizobium sp. RU36D TaxID=1907415 RepID=UPI0009D826F1|nr:sialic acid TRAP transporter substrate-binding protein SiaP [Rhizobium sp. RU36D]SMC98534.1 tripartite ATP-independent transporter solute receptor, DctP family [Rhizobium sp. RU36D]